jgi:bacteriophage N4 adsorption protein B
VPTDALDLLVRTVAWPVGAAILANQLDESIVDANYVLRGLYRKKTRAIPYETLRDVRQKRIAIVVPAWKEAEVIEQMLEHNLATLDYAHDRYDIFVGTYPNDPDTQAGVDAVAARHPSIHKVVVPHDGPTSKADCLNWVYQGIILEERRRDVRFEILLMHDAEDVIHPLSLRLYSLLIPESEFVQTPVFSLPLPLGDVVSGTYVDEFSEHHLKEMRVRSAARGLVPSAGVGSAFDRDAFEEIATSHGQKPFNTESLTEDYEIGLKFRLAGRRVSFACHTVARPGAPEEYIATREYFPSALGASIRQRSRWILGITLQTWAQLGWKGPPIVRYCLWRDRKAIVTNVLLVLGYLLVLYVLARMAIGQVTGSGWAPAWVIPPGTLLYDLLFLNLFAFLARAAVKVWFVRQLHGWGHALVSPARLLVGNGISVVATFRAVKQYVKHRMTGEPLRWLKTTHAFPSFEALAGAVPRPAPVAVPRPVPVAVAAVARVSAVAELGVIGPGNEPDEAYGDAEYAYAEHGDDAYAEAVPDLAERRAARSASGGAAAVMRPPPLPGGGGIRVSQTASLPGGRDGVNG